MIGHGDYEQLLDALGLRALIVTAGPNGAKVLDSSGARTLKTISVANPVDICGAGDSFSAAAASALAAGAGIEEAVQLGNLVASITIMKKGTGTATPVEVREAAGKAGIE